MKFIQFSLSLKFVRCGVLVMLLLSSAHFSQAQTEVWLSTNRPFISTEIRPTYYSICFVVKDRKVYPTTNTIEVQESIEAWLAYLIKNRLDTTIIMNGFPFSYTFKSWQNGLTVYSRKKMGIDSTLYYYDGLNKVSRIESTEKIWHYDSKTKEGYTLAYKKGTCRYDDQSRIVKVEEEYAGGNAFPELYVHWYCYYRNDDLYYYVKYLSRTKEGPYKFDGLFLLHYSDSPEPPDKKQLEKEVKAIFSQIPNVVNR